MKEINLVELSRFGILLLFFCAVYFLHSLSSSKNLSKLVPTLAGHITKPVNDVCIPTGQNASPEQELSRKLVSLQRKLVRDIQAGIELPYGSLAVPNSMLEYFLHRANSSRCGPPSPDSHRELKRVFLKGLAGGGINFVALGGSQTRGMHWDNPQPTDSWPHKVFAWLNETFPSPRNSVKNSGIPGAGGNTPLLCLHAFLTSAPDLVIGEYEVNPTREEDGRALFQSILEWPSSPALVYLTLIHCWKIFNYKAARCSYLSEAEIGRLAMESWDIALSHSHRPRCTRALKAASDLNIPIIDYTSALTSYGECALMQSLGPGNLTENALSLCYNIHWNMQGLDLLAKVVVRYFIDVILSLTDDDVVAYLASSRPLSRDDRGPEDYARDGYVCSTTKWGFIGSPFNCEMSTELVPVRKTIGWELVKVREDKELYRSLVPNSTITFHVDSRTRGRLAVAYMKSPTLGLARVQVRDSRGSLLLQNVVNATGEQGFFLYEAEFLPIVLEGPGELTVDLQVLDTPSPAVGFGTMGLFHVPCKKCPDGVGTALVE